MKRYFIRYAFIFLMGQLAVDAAGMGAKFYKGAARLAEEAAISTAYPALGGAANSLRDKKPVNVQTASGSSVRSKARVPQIGTIFGRAFGAGSTVFGRSLTNTSSQSSLNKNSSLASSAQKKRSLKVLFPFQATASTRPAQSARQSTQTRQSLAPTVSGSSPSTKGLSMDAIIANRFGGQKKAATQVIKPKKVKKQKKETAQHAAQTQSLPRSPSTAQESASAASVVRGLKKKMAQTQPAQATESTVPAAVKASVATLPQAAQQPTNELVIIPAAAAFKSKSPKVKHTFKISEQFAQILADMFQRAQSMSAQEGTMIQAPVVAPFNELGKLSKLVAQQKLKPCIVGEDFIRQLMGSNKFNGSILSDAHNKILGVIGKKTAQGYASCLFDESIITAITRKMVTAQGSNGKIEAVYRPHAEGKAVAKQIGYSQQPDIFVFLTKNDQKLRSNIQEIFNILSGSFVDPQGAPHLPSIAIVRSGSVVPLFGTLMQKDTMLHAPHSKKPVHVKADIPQPEPVIEPDVQHAQNTAPSDAQQESVHTTFTNNTPRKPAQPQPTAQQKGAARKSARNAAQQQYAAAYNAGMAMPLMMGEGGRASVSEKPGVSSSTAAPQEQAQAVPQVQAENMESAQSEKVEGLKKGTQSAEKMNTRSTDKPTFEKAQEVRNTEKPPMPKRAAPKAPARAHENPFKNTSDSDVEQPKSHHDKGHKSGVKARPRSGGRNVHRPSPQMSSAGEDLFNFHEMFNEGIELSPIDQDLSPEKAAEGSGSRKDPVFTETYPEIERNRPAQAQQDAAAANKPAQQDQPAAQPVTADAADDNDVSSSPRYNYKPDGSYHPGYDQVGSGAPQNEQPMQAQPTEQSRVPQHGKKDTPGAAIPQQRGASAGGPITGAAVAAQDKGMDLPDTKVSKFDAYGMPLIENTAKVRIADNKSVTPMSKAQKNNALMPSLTTQEAVATTMPAEAPAAPTAVGILSLIGMILTIVASAVLRILFAPFRLF